MPKIFSEEDRLIIREKLLQAGLTLLETKTYKSIALDEVTQMIGIAKGTFYNFFSSKESFFYEIMQLIKTKNRKPLIALFSEGCPTVSQIEACLFHRYTAMKTVYDYFTVEEMKLIVRKVPLEEIEEDSTSFAQQMLRKCGKEQVNTDVVVNMFNILAMAESNRAMLNTDGYEESIRLIVHALATYMMEEETI